jgi:kynurenine formamidase
VLLDVAAAHGVDSLPAWQAITADDLDRAERRQVVSVAAGNVVCIRTGWGAHFADAPRYLGSATGVPGLGETAARWLAARGATAAGTDTWAFEHVPSGGVPERLPVHRILLFEHRVHLLENLNLEAVAAATATDFVFVGLPLRIVGATGSPLRPVAVLG